jgi:hypothetical protein
MCQTDQCLYDAHTYSRCEDATFATVTSVMQTAANFQLQGTAQHKPCRVAQDHKLHVPACMQGKWVLEPQVQMTGFPPITVVKYAVEMAIDTGPLGLIEPLMDKGLQEDMPRCLAAIRRAAEGLEGATASTSDGPRREIQTFDELQAQLTMMYKDTMVMPRHKELLAAGRCAVGHCRFVVWVRASWCCVQRGRALSWLLRPHLTAPGVTCRSLTSSKRCSP